MPTLSSSPAIVLDTNVVLDWLVFRDPSCQALGEAIEQRRISWLADAGMRAELDEVLRRGVGASRAPDLGVIDLIWQRHAVMLDRSAVTSNSSVGAATPCRCSDPDDQPFIDLALESGARWLLSRDLAVLKLAREARSFGLEILSPAVWSLQLSHQ